MSDKMEVVGNCAQCGSPIWAAPCKSGSCPPRNVYSCDCRNQKKTTQDSTKPMVKYG